MIAINFPARLENGRYTHTTDENDTSPIQTERDERCAFCMPECQPRHSRAMHERSIERVRDARLAGDHLSVDGIDRTRMETKILRKKGKGPEQPKPEPASPGSINWAAMLDGSYSKT